MTKRVIFWNIKTEPNEGKFQFEEGIGAHKLSTIAQEEGFDTVIYQDHQFGANPDRIVEATRAQLNGDCIIAYSLLSNGIPLLEELVQKNIAPNVPSVIGGAGATIEPERVLRIYGSKHTPVSLVQGDGEIHFRNLIRLQPKEWSGVEGVWSIGADGQIIRGSYSVIPILDSSPFADLSASAQRNQTERDVENESLPLERRVELLKSLMISQIESGRGCYYNCEFCSTSSLEVKKPRKSSPKRLVDEMGHMFEKYGITFFSITDNVAFDKAEWWLEFVSLMNDSPITPYIQFGGYSAPKFVNNPEWIERVVPELYSVGLRGIILGVQAGAKRVLRDIVHRQSDDPENALSFVRQAVPIGVNVKVDFIVGHPTETVEELEVTHHWINEIYNAGGEVFVRRLGVVPNSGYHTKIAQGVYTLPEETPEFNDKISEVLGMKAKDERYKQIAFANGRIPHKYIADRDLGIVYPSTEFDIERLEADALRLNDSSMPEMIKDRYRRMFELVIELKRTKRYKF